jgi:hypothetical protein
MNAVFRNNYFYGSYPTHSLFFIFSCIFSYFIYDNTFRLQASGSLVENNYFESAAFGMQVTFDQTWLEGSLGLHNIFIFNLFFSLFYTYFSFDDQYIFPSLIMFSNALKVVLIKISVFL